MSTDFLDDRYRLIYLYLFLILLGVIIVYLPGLNDQYILYDTPQLVLNNPHVSNITWENLRSIFQIDGGTYQPIRDLSYAVDGTLFGKEYIAFFLHNLFLYLVTLILLFFFLKKLFDEAKIPLIITAIFAFHPLHVESVRWIAARKDVLCGVFVFAAALLYITGEDSERFKYRITFLTLSFMSFLLGLLSKPTALFFPLLLGVIVLLRYRKNKIKRLLRQIPFWLVDLVIFIYLLFFTQLVFVKEFRWGNLYIAFLNIMKILGKYVGRFFLPLRLSHRYAVGISTKISSPEVLIPLISFFVMLGITIYVIRKGVLKQSFGLLFFWVAYLPVSNIIPLIIMADRYMFFPILGLIIFLVYFIMKGLREYIDVRFVFGFFAAIILILGVLSFLRVKKWQNTKTLARASLKQNSDNANLHYQLSDYFFRKGKIDSAEKHAQIAASNLPWYMEPHYLLQDIYKRKGKYYSLIGDIKSTFHRAKDTSRYLSNLLLAYLRIGDSESGRRIIDTLRAMEIESGDYFYYKVQLLKKGELSRSTGKDLLLRGISRGFSNPRYYLDTYKFFKEEEETNTAEVVIDSASARFPDNEIFSLLQGSSGRDKGRLIKELKADFRKLLKKRWAGKAIDTLYYLHFLGSHPDGGYRKIGKIYEDRGDYSRAISFYKDELEYTEEITLYEKIGQMYEQLRVFPDSAARYFELALKRSDSAGQRRQIRHKVDSLRKATAGGRQHFLYGLDLFKQGKYKQALFVFQKLRELGPSNFVLYNFIGACYAQLSRLDKAFDSWKKAIELSPQNPDTYFHMGVAYSRLDSISKAESSFKKFLKYAKPNDKRRKHAKKWLYKFGGN